jgi:hypothetical protein
MKRHPSTGKISYFGLFFHEKLAGRIWPGPVQQGGNSLFPVQGEKRMQTTLAGKL